ncbi:MAG TPA: murein L,D-transpeptidase catalytic domain family protein [Chitinophagaceae bacterium]|nr:murein L,D-transpeptidase catalytic domain family protein [Chitinophagaceae bacterium]
MMKLERKSVVGRFSVLALILIPFVYFVSSSNARNATELHPKTVVEPVKPIQTQLYEKLRLQDSLLPEEVFNNAYVGFRNMIEAQAIDQNASILTVIDMSQSSNKKRMWIIDIASQEILLNTYVAHGRNSGNEFAKQHSNQLNSYQSSPGFYRTANAYYGKHGLSLRLEGLDTMYNDLAMRRAIVLHGADYVHEDFIKQHSRLGRSLGCPAVPQKDRTFIIETIKDGHCLYIHFDDPEYIANSKWLQNRVDVQDYSQLSILESLLEQKNYWENLVDSPVIHNVLSENKF